MEAGSHLPASGAEAHLLAQVGLNALKAIGQDTEVRFASSILGLSKYHRSRLRETSRHATYCSIERLNTQGPSALTGLIGWCGKGVTSLTANGAQLAT